MKKYSIILLLFLTSCSFETPTKFSEKALNENLISIQNETVLFKEIIEKYQGKKVLINVWASWCADCIKGLPELKKIQKSYPSVIFLNISVDENSLGWRKGIERFQILGEHYNLPKGMKNGDLVDFLNLRWIPRYIIVDEKGSISLFKATKITDERILATIKTN
ncbi:TlpA family protein disulfide reductase [Polaribacter gangjinensis]|uniref:Redoxin n=1 Tax=Polaribacter gangjinensis TaxID=574710 RepID=A0A2S7WEF5_9FLAO|nr:TlpA disulfide reductase family protein [Polaribacter gangjinensis]PQJ76018.1 redoxin [Polaribacter gangjinensis]